MNLIGVVFSSLIGGRFAPDCPLCFPYSHFYPARLVLLPAPWIQILTPSTARFFFRWPKGQLEVRGLLSIDRHDALIDIHYLVWPSNGFSPTSSGWYRVSTTPFLFLRNEPQLCRLPGTIYTDTVLVGWVVRTVSWRLILFSFFDPSIVLLGYFRMQAVLLGSVIKFFVRSLRSTIPLSPFCLVCVSGSGHNVQPGRWSMGVRCCEWIHNSVVPTIFYELVRRKDCGIIRGHNARIPMCCRYVFHQLDRWLGRRRCALDSNFWLFRFRIYKYEKMKTELRASVINMDSIEIILRFVPLMSYVFDRRFLVEGTLLTWSNRSFYVCIHGLPITISSG